MDMIAVPGQKQLVSVDIVQAKLDILFSLFKILNLEDIDLQSLLVLSHITQNNSLGLVKIRICVPLVLRSAFLAVRLTILGYSAKSFPECILLARPQKRDESIHQVLPIIRLSILPSFQISKICSNKLVVKLGGKVIKFVDYMLQILHGKVSVDAFQEVDDFVPR